MGAKPAALSAAAASRAGAAACRGAGRSCAGLGVGRATRAAASEALASLVVTAIDVRKRSVAVISRRTAGGACGRSRLCGSETAVATLLGSPAAQQSSCSAAGAAGSAKIDAAPAADLGHERQRSGCASAAPRATGGSPRAGGRRRRHFDLQLRERGRRQDDGNVRLRHGPVVAGAVDSDRDVDIDRPILRSTRLILRWAFPRCIFRYCIRFAAIPVPVPRPVLRPDLLRDRDFRYCIATVPLPVPRPSVAGRGGLGRCRLRCRISDGRRCGRYRRLILRRIRLILRGGLDRRCKSPVATAAFICSTEPLSPGLSTRTETLTFVGAVCSTSGVDGGASGAGSGVERPDRRFSGRCGGRCGDRPSRDRLRGSRLGGNCRKSVGGIDHGHRIELGEARFLENRRRGLRQIGKGRNRHVRNAALGQSRGTRGRSKRKHRQADNSPAGASSPL